MVCEISRHVGAILIQLQGLCIERRQFRWFRRLIRMPPERLPAEVFWACPTGRKPRGGPRPGNTLKSICREQVEDVTRVRDVWDTFPAITATQTRISHRKWMNEWMDIYVSLQYVHIHTCLWERIQCFCLCVCLQGILRYAMFTWRCYLAVSGRFRLASETRNRETEWDE